MTVRVSMLAMFAVSLMATPALAASVTVEFPSAIAQTSDGALGGGGGGIFFNTGNFVTQTFSTGLASATSATWDFTMFNFTRGANSKFDVLINGIKVDSYEMFGCANYCNATNSFSFSQSFAEIAGTDYVLSLVATSTVASGDGSWNWFPGGSVTLSNGAVPEPASWAMMIGGLGLVGGAMRRRTAKGALAA
nr:PEPxxWA-CTERM sorting domain-containing protein [Polymorphobacter sp.]